MVPIFRSRLYVSLLIGDLQIRRVIGTLPPLDEAAIAVRAERARLVVEARYRACESATAQAPGMRPTDLRQG
ncbi:hypothetical protein [Roseospirillum parvum]|uniref:Uncharacterized protein n=1 Tax=Roseospirillum parvum TaxID=83401 RepID=A0A1G8AQF1_9PROT|nr:hypothetical protein [Roseospirillum parvum]SDH23195.1 hypothetical protein SAMN05421742_10573 [Roseospirillum parvum]